MSATLQGVVNFRDVGGHRTRDGATVRTGWIYRAAHFSRATDDDIAVLTQLGVQLFVDFRGPADIEADGHNRMPDGARLVSIPMYDPAGANDIRTLLSEGTADEIHSAFGGGRAHEAMVRGAAALVTQPDRIAGYSTMLHTLIDATTPSVIHCSAGKDRTGWGASLILLTLGVPEETVIEHYLESNRHQRDQRDLGTSPKVDRELLRPFFEVRAEYARAALDAMQTTFGGIDTYVRDALGVGDADVARFRDQMLT
jgi:protein-tyrosine phosphatase